MRAQIILLLLALVGCQNAENQKMKEVEHVNEVILQLIEADNRSDINAVLRSYTSDVEFHPKGRPAFRGIDEVERSYQSLFKDNKLDLATSISRTTLNGDSAIVMGINKGTRTSLTDSTVFSIHDHYEAHMIRNGEGIWKIRKLYWSPVDSTFKQ